MYRYMLYEDDFDFESVSPMLKNLGKYNNIKLCKGLILNTVKSRKRDGDMGISTGEHGDKWFMLPKGRAIFKSYDDGGSYFDSIKNMRIVNELLCYELAKSVGVLCAEYELANYHNTQGIVTYNVTKPGEKLINADDFLNNVEEAYLLEGFRAFSKAIKEYQEKGYKINEDKVMKSLYKIALFDCLTSQSDRHNFNLFFIVNESKKTIKVAPLIDNELAFNLKWFEEMLYENSKIDEKLYVRNLDRICDIVQINSVFPFNKFMDNIKELIYIAKTKPEYAQIFKDMVSNFHILPALDKIEAMGIEINDDYYNYILLAEKAVKDRIKFYLKKSEKSNADDYRLEEYDFLK